jgi:hypothetical protein
VDHDVVPGLDLDHDLKGRRRLAFEHGLLRPSTTSLFIA